MKSCSHEYFAFHLIHKKAGEEFKKLYDKKHEVEPLRQEPEAPFQNATSRDWQKAFNPQRELGAFCSGVITAAERDLKKLKDELDTQGTIMTEDVEENKRPQ